MKGQTKPCWTPFPISTIILSRTGVGPWTLGLGYGASVSSSTKRNFRENKIDAEVLSDLTDGDLEKIGVSLSGHRKRLLKAIASLRCHAPAAKPTTPRAPTPVDGRRRAPPDYGDVLRSCRLDEPRRET